MSTYSEQSFRAKNIGENLKASIADSDLSSQTFTKKVNPGLESSVNPFSSVAQEISNKIR